MRRRRVRARFSTSLALALPLFTLVVTAGAAPQTKKLKPLDHASYDRWSQISRASLSNDGKWVLYTTRPAKGDSVVRLLEIKSGRQFVLKRSRSERLSFDSRFIAYLTTPAPRRKRAGSEDRDAETVAQGAREENADQNNAEDVAGHHGTGQRSPHFDHRREVLRDASQGGNWIAYLVPEATQEGTEKPESTKIREVEVIGKSATKKPSKTGGARKSKKPAKAVSPKAAPKKAPARKTAKTTRSTVGTLAVRNLTTGMEMRFSNVQQFRFSENGKHLVWSTAASDAGRCGVFVLNTGNLSTRQIAKGKKSYRNLTFDKSGNNLAFFISTSSSSKSERSLYHWKAGRKTAIVVARSGQKGFSKDRRIASTSSCSFSENGTRIFFSNVKRAPKKPKAKPQPKTKTAPAKPSPVQVDIWHWKDPYLQPMQLVRAGLRGTGVTRPSCI